jgi:hypothetical protein
VRPSRSLAHAPGVPGLQSRHHAPAWQRSAAILRVNALDGLEQKVALAIGRSARASCANQAAACSLRLTAILRIFSLPSFPRATIAAGSIARASIARAPRIGHATPSPKTRPRSARGQIFGYTEPKDGACAAKGLRLEPSVVESTHRDWLEAFDLERHALRRWRPEAIPRGGRVDQRGAKIHGAAVSAHVTSFPSRTAAALCPSLRAHHRIWRTPLPPPERPCLSGAASRFRRALPEA